MPNRKNKYIDWLTMFLLIGNSANPFFYLSIEMLSASFVILLILWVLKDGETIFLNRYFYIYIALMLALQIAQSFTYELFPLKTFLGEYLRIAFAVFALKILGSSYFESFVKFVLLFAVISLCFYIPSVLIKGFAPFMINHVAKFTMAPFTGNVEGMYISKESVILFNFNQIELNRNSGFYWEPGTHGGFLILALFLNLFYRKHRLFAKSSLILIFTILTTLSTTTYLALFIVIIFSLRDFLLRRPAVSLVLLAAIIGGFMILYTRLDFLNNKINKQIEYSNKGVPGESRFNSFLADMRILGDHPFIGTGRNIEMKFGKKFYSLGARQVHRNNGVGVLLATYGIFFFILFFYMMGLSFYGIVQDKGIALMGVLLVLIIGFSEDYFFKVYFISLALYSGTTLVRENVRKSYWYKKMELGGRRVSNRLT